MGTDTSTTGAVDSSDGPSPTLDSTTGAPGGSSSGAVDSTSDASPSSSAATETGTDTGDGADMTEDTDTSGEMGDESGTGTAVAGVSEWGLVNAICLQTGDEAVLAGSLTTTLDEGPAFVESLAADGTGLWRIEYGTAGTATFFYDVACAPDGSVYAVGMTGVQLFGHPRPFMVKIDGVTGVEQWHIVLDEPNLDGWFHGAYADDDGVYVVGHYDPSAFDSFAPFVAHYSPEGLEDWRVNDTIAGKTGPLNEVRRHGDTVFVTGEAGLGISEAWVIAMTPDGDFEWDHTVQMEDDTSGYYIEPDPQGAGVFVALQHDDNPLETQWVLTCTETGCPSDPQPLASLSDFHGFAVDQDGNWLAVRDGSVEARVPGGDVAWSFDADYFQPFYDLPKVLAVDSAGAIVVGGSNDEVPELTRFSPPAP